MQMRLCSGVLPNPMPGSSTMRSRGMPARQAISSEREKNSVHSAKMSIAGSAVSRLCMMMTGACVGDDARHVGVALQAPHVVDDRGAGLECPGRHRSFHRIDRDRNAEPDHGRQDAGKAAALLIERHRNRIAVGPRRFRADIENVGAFDGKALRLGNGGGRIEKAAAVGKRVRRDIEDAHDQRALFLKKIA